MALKHFKPITNGSRHRIILSKPVLKNVKIVKNLRRGLLKKSGRNNLGKIITFHRGGGHKRLYRIIDFKRQYFKEKAQIVHKEYDPNRSAFIALIRYASGHLAYILAPHLCKAGDFVSTSFKISKNNSKHSFLRKSGTSLPLFLVPKGSLIHNIELSPGKGGQLIRAAGTCGKVIDFFKKGYASIELPSGSVRLIPLLSIVTLGTVSNKERRNIVFGKAGAVRWLNKKPVVRGMAMNPIDHPHGGGQGKAKGRLSSTPWAKLTKGPKTRSNKSTNKFILKYKKK
eukprot:c18466_g1_i1.p1 GENE.c18466_g1_i1~~c18466_g1_i1.p1  ORF type:complete len:284 (-),score=-74.02 c18466_g1_i1:632-1483(-)